MKPQIVLCASLTLLLARCAGDYHSQYDASIRSNDYTAAKSYMELEIQALSVRDYNPTLPLRIANAYYRLAYAHGMLGRYDEMRRSLSSGVSHDPGLTNQRQRMLEHFEIREFNNAVASYNAGDHTTALMHLTRSLSIVETEDPHKKCMGLILRSMATAALAAGDLRSAISYCQRAMDLGDPAADAFMTKLKSDEDPAPPARLDERSNVQLRFL